MIDEKISESKETKETLDKGILEFIIRNPKNYKPILQRRKGCV